MNGSAGNPPKPILNTVEALKHAPLAITSPAGLGNLVPTGPYCAALLLRSAPFLSKGRDGVPGEVCNTMTTSRDKYKNIFYEKLLRCAIVFLG